MHQVTERTGYATVNEVAAHLRLSRATIYNLMDRLAIRYSKFGSSRRIAWADVRRYENESKVEAMP